MSKVPPLAGASHWAYVCLYGGMWPTAVWWVGVGLTMAWGPYSYSTWWQSTLSSCDWNYMCCGACSMRCYVAAAAQVVSCSKLRPKCCLSTERSGAQISSLVLYFLFECCISCWLLYFELQFLSQYVCKPAASYFWDVSCCFGFNSAPLLRVYR